MAEDDDVVIPEDGEDCSCRTMYPPEPERLDLNEHMRELVDEVYATLGSSLVDVELPETDIIKCFKKAKRIFIQQGHNSYRREFMVLPVSINSQTYNIPKEIDTVVKIIRPGTGFSLEDGFSQLAYNELFNGLGTSGGGCCNRGGFDFLTYELTLDNLERMRRVSAYEIQFQHDKFKNTLRLLKAPRGAEKWLVEVYVNLDDEEYAQIDWIIRWTIAEAKAMLGVAYRKFGSLAAPTGETQLSGSEYIQESNSEKELLMNEIENLVDGASDFYEIRFG